MFLLDFFLSSFFKNFIETVNFLLVGKHILHWENPYFPKISQIFTNNKNLPPKIMTHFLPNAMVAPAGFSMKRKINVDFNEI
jgi:hypothetical protein